MVIDLTKLAKDKPADISENIVIPNDKLKEANIISMDPIKVIGSISKDDFEDYFLNIDITGKMVLPCSRTLEPVDYPFQIKVSENLEEDENFKKSQKTIDILPIIWENILLEIPMRIISPKASQMKTKGEGWELITEEKENHSLAKLKDLL
jgi:uncharacterized protein